jgi:hypothetical protein
MRGFVRDGLLRVQNAPHLAYAEERGQVYFGPKPPVGKQGQLGADRFSPDLRPASD